MFQQPNEIGIGDKQICTLLSKDLDECVSAAAKLSDLLEEKHYPYRIIEELMEVKHSRIFFLVYFSAIKKRKPHWH